MALPDQLEGEDVIITFEEEESGVITNTDGRIMSWNIGGGSQPTEDVYAFGGKTFNFQKPREKFTLSFDVMINNTTFDYVQFGAYDSTDTVSTSNKLIMSDQSTKRWRVILWFQDSAYHISNSTGSVVVPSKVQPIYRIICVDVKSVTFDKEFSADEYMKGTLNLEFSATDSSGNPNFIEQEGMFTGTTSTELASMTTTSVNSTTGNVGLLVKARGYMTWNTTTPSWTAGTTTTRYRYTG